MPWYIEAKRSVYDAHRDIHRGEKEEATATEKKLYIKKKLNYIATNRKTKSELSLKCIATIRK